MSGGWEILTNLGVAFTYFSSFYSDNSYEKDLNKNLPNVRMIFFVTGIMLKQALQGVPHSDIQVELD